MDTLFAFLTIRLEQFVSALMGPTARDDVVGPFTRSDIAVALVYLGLALIINMVAALYVNRRPRQAAPPVAPDLHRNVVNALGKPLYILIWIYGLYLAATPVRIKLKPEQGLVAFRAVVDFMLDLGAFGVVFWFLFRATRILESRLALLASKTPRKTDKLLVPLLGSSLRVIVIVVAVILGLPLLGLPASAATLLSKLTSIVLILSVAALSIRAVNIFQAIVLARYDMTAADNLRARKVYTQLHVISRVIYATIGVFALSAILMLFQEVRHIGTSLLASAGIVGIIAGFAAQKTLANLFAGFQIALAQPIRQDDVVVVEGEWGRVEEITLSYVIVHIWDDRRLVLPLTYFIEKPFQNWTRTSSALLGCIFVWVDYSFPVEEARAAVKAIVESCTLWDGRFWNLQVSDATEKTMQLRILATSADSSRSWDLRCEIREKFIAYVQQHHPTALPRFRADVAGLSR